MSLTAADVAELMRLVEQSGFDELTLELDGMKITLRRGEAPVRSSVDPESSTARPRPFSSAVENVPAAADPKMHEVASPLLGTFYRAPKPGAPPYVEVGVQVEEETVVAIIEVMKLMNTVRAGVRGTVTEILVTDGQLAEYGQTLMRVRKAG
ncbi:MAG: acetyl-CoA carboxylase biotin carboxyl carrier protein [Terriglobales bacterium]